MQTLVACLTAPCAGAKSEDEALAAAKKFTRLIQRVGHPEATVVSMLRALATFIRV